MSEEIRDSNQEYEPPKLHKHGTVKDLTLASSGSASDSSGYSNGSPPTS